jgi:hypothetical protein
LLAQSVAVALSPVSFRLACRLTEKYAGSIANEVQTAVPFVDFATTEIILSK